MTTNTSLNGIARQLVNHNLVDEDTAVEASERAKKSGKEFISTLIDTGTVNAAAIAQYVAADFGLSCFDLNSLAVESIPTDYLNEELLTTQNAVPIAKRGSKLFIAISDPTNSEPLDKYKFSSGLSVEAVIVEDDKLAELRVRALDQNNSLSDGLDDGFDLDEDEPHDSEIDEDEVSGIEETPVVRYINKILFDAIKRGASDIHVEPYEKIFRIRYRVDGILEEVARPPLSMSGRLTARLKVMSRMDISERRIPQDGRIKLKVSKTKAIDFRVNTCPTLFGEKTVLRILDPSSAQLGIDALGYEPEQKKLYMDALANPYGMILVTGPTGSGKTVSLYTGLNILNEPGTNISTAEDPAEINLEGINQVNVNVKAGLTFAEALKSFLRQDPDIIMVGEIRDLETASIAIKAAQTGHMVMSTLHTNDAPQTLSRLINMGVPPFNIATAVSLIIAQRLGRRLCSACKVVDTELPKEVLIAEGFDETEIDGLEIYKATGCSKCNSGYKGRVGIYQVMKISEDIGKIIMAGGNAIEIANQAKKEKIPDLRESALKKVAQGVLSLEEANRVTKD
ncbi:type IV-A pilus assembly ATPase PilB [Granulosicoccus sp.]|nr:type IV-A pilus assembly ATPase PilB [Granulosicoccus sp.]MDB4222832.1 type IV-A pilus assembly ATPase PilB [Granulosicoccus sp.]